MTVQRVKHHTDAVADPVCHAGLHAVANMAEQGVHTSRQVGAVSENTLRQYRAVRRHMGVHLLDAVTHHHYQSTVGCQVAVPLYQRVNLVRRGIILQRVIQVGVSRIAVLLYQCVNLIRSGIRLQSVVQGLQGRVMTVQRVEHHAGTVCQGLCGSKCSKGIAKAVPHAVTNVRPENIPAQSVVQVGVCRIAVLLDQCVNLVRRGVRPQRVVQVGVCSIAILLDQCVNLVRRGIGLQSVVQDP